MPEPMAVAHFESARAQRDLRRAIRILRDHGLKRSWCHCAELLVGLTKSDVHCDAPVLCAAPAAEGAMETEEEPELICEATLTELETEPVTDAFLLASSYFELSEYTRCAVALTGCEKGGGALPATEPSDEAPSREVFMWAYSLYLAGEKRKEEEILEAKSNPIVRMQAVNAMVEPLRDVLEERRSKGLLKGLAVYALGIVYKELATFRSVGGYEEGFAGDAGSQAADEQPTDDEGSSGSRQRGSVGTFAESTPVESDVKKACELLAQSVRIFPWNWSAWLDIAELSSPSTDHRHVDAVMAAAKTRRLPDELGAVFGSPEILQGCFASHVAIEQQHSEIALRVLGELKVVLQDATFVVAQEALAHYAQRNFEAAQERFEVLRAADPYRLEHLDIYSNVLYVKEQRVELSRLAHSALRIEKYRPETCCIIGNYYSLKRMHERAVIYFRRALRLDRQCLSAWTLMGHEYIEMKNINAAIEAYRRAVDTNARDYRAWYGLGQTYEILNMHFYALYYYHKAARYRPYDARMWIALAQCHEKIHKIDDAIRLYQRAANYDDAEGVAIFRLAKLYRQRRDDVSLRSYVPSVIVKASWLSQDRATECYQRYIDSLPEDTDIHESIAEALLYLAARLKQRHKFQAAQAHLVKLLDFTGPEKLEAQAM